MIWFRQNNISTVLTSLGILLATASIIAAAETSAPLPADHAEKMAEGLRLFQSEVATVLKQNCIKCHGGEKTKGDFDLATREDLLRGGKDGPAVVPFQSGSSTLLKMVRHEVEPAMPDKADKLSENAIATIDKWISLGAPYSEPLVAGRKPAKDKSVVTAEDKQWWSFQPIKPADTGATVDSLILANSNGLTLAPAAEKRVLLRRASLDLIGLPPTIDELAAFENDASPDAWEKVVDRLLAYPRYGELWARHWLDVARFAESSGFEHDYDRPNAYHYRDFVIKALNEDMPYDQFIHWQLAGDEFAPGNGFAMSATGFLGAGVFPTQITANEVERTRYDAMDDMLSTTGSAMLGLTIGCARCHDHKFDPIPTKDYYRLLSTFTTTVRSDVELDLDPKAAAEASDKWERALLPIKLAVEEAQNSVRPDFEHWLEKPQVSDTWMAASLDNLKSKGGATFKPLDDGSYLADGANAAQDEYTFTCQTRATGITAIKLEALAHPSMVGGGPGRAANGNIGLSNISLTATPPGGGAAQPIKLVKAAATHQQNTTNLSVAAAIEGKGGWAVDGKLGRDHAAVFTFAESLNLPAGSTISVKLEFALNTSHNIGRPRVSFSASAEPKLEAAAIPLAVELLIRKKATTGTLTDEEKQRLFAWWSPSQPAMQKAQQVLDKHLAAKPKGTTPTMICAEGYPAIRMHTQGADFFPETFILRRGSTDQKGEVASQSFLQVLMSDSESAKRWAFTPPTDSKYSGRRRALASWITDTSNGAGSLAARVMANRVWLHHFGRGICPTPDDFGKSGALPSNPALLDFLAAELVKNCWKLKPLHRQILLSKAYQQSAAKDEAKELADPANATFTRRLPRRLQAETLRDQLLAVSGLLDNTMYGQGNKDERSRRRSIYFTIKRSQLMGSMVAFDAPEPLVTQGLRPTTTVAPQALLLINSAQSREWAEAFAKRILQQPGAVSEKLDFAWKSAVGRSPSAQELESITKFLQSESADRPASEPQSELLEWTDLAQVIFSLNEFAYAP